MAEKDKRLKVKSITFSLYSIYFTLYTLPPLLFTLYTLLFYQSRLNNILKDVIHSLKSYGETDCSIINIHRPSL